MDPTTEDRRSRQTMPESRLFMSSLSRRELARRRPGRAHIWRMRLLGVLLVAIVVVVFLVEHGGA
ncbi:MAG TPA: hypothetical protein VHV28_15660 [Solirubrobacteraceae bacterium]|nr:hypothetical protein [Solirubrobacteraceae bacterium]